MRRRRKIVMWVAVVFSLSETVCFAVQIFVPPMSDIAQGASTIVGGTIEVGESQEAAIVVDEVFKGQCKSGKRIVLTLKDDVMDFSLGDFLSPYRGQRIITLGHYDEATQILELPWSISTVLPYGYKANEFPAETYGQCKAFIESILMYQEMGRGNKDVLTNKLLEDIGIPDKRCAVLCFSGHMLSVALDDKELERELMAVFMAEIATPRPEDPNGIVEPCVVNNITRLMPLLPPSICASYLANVSAIKEHPRAQLALTHARSVLTIRRMAKPTEIETPEQLQIALRKKLRPLRVFDANKAMRLFDSPNQRLKDAAEKVVGMALGDSVKPDASVQDKKAFWQKRLEANIERLSEEDRSLVRRAGVK